MRENHFGRVILYVKMQFIDLHLFLKYYFLTVAFGHFASANQICGVCISGRLEDCLRFDVLIFVQKITSY